jgi:hypothetical protein
VSENKDHAPAIEGSGIEGLETRDQVSVSMNPPTAELEAFWTGGCSAYRPANLCGGLTDLPEPRIASPLTVKDGLLALDPGAVGPLVEGDDAGVLDMVCCAGIDQPGVGFTHASDCPARPGQVVRSGLRFLLPGRDAVVGEVPHALRDYLRMELLPALMLAARTVAEARVNKSFNSHNELAVSMSCQECHFGATSDGILHHARSCNVGQTLRLVDEILAALVSEANSMGKENAQAHREAGAGDGIRPRVGLMDRISGCVDTAAARVAPNCLQAAVEIVRVVVYRAEDAPVKMYGDAGVRAIGLSDGTLADWQRTLSDCDAFLTGKGGVR